MQKLLFVAAVAVVSATALAQPKGGAPAPAQPKTGTPATPPAHAGHAGAKADPMAKPVVGPTELVTVKPAEIKFIAGPPSLPAGAEMAVLSGDPKAEGPFVMRLRLPAKYKLPNHWHPAHEHVTVLEGAFWLGHGETWDDKKLAEHKVGAFVMMPPKHGHYAMTKKRTIIQVHGWGPWAINYFNASDDPRTKPPATPAAAKPEPTKPLK